MSALTHVRVNLSPTAERVLSRRQHLAHEAAAARRRDEAAKAQGPTGESDGEAGA